MYDSWGTDRYQIEMRSMAEGSLGGNGRHVDQYYTNHPLAAPQDNVTSSE